MLTQLLAIIHIQEAIRENEAQPPAIGQPSIAIRRTDGPLKKGHVKIVVVLCPLVFSGSVFLDVFGNLLNSHVGRIGYHKLVLQVAFK